MDATLVKVGMKVICIDDSFNEEPGCPFRLNQISLPKKGVMYTVREIDTGYEGGNGLRLKEITNKQFPYKKGGVKEPMFKLSRFKKA